MKHAAIIGLAHTHIFSMIQEILEEKDALRIQAVCDPDSPEQVKKAVEMVPGVNVYDDMDELLRTEKIDIVISSSVFGDKSDIAVKSLKAGKHIWIDKPLATTAAGLEQIETELTEHPSLKASLWLTERYAPTYYTAKQLIDSGEIGEVVHLYFVRPHRLAPETRPDWFFDRVKYGGILNDIGVHDLDLARWFTRSECRQIMAAHAGTRRYRDYALEDEGSAMFMMECGATGMIFENWLTPDRFPIHGDTRATIYGTRGQIEIKSWPESVVIYSDTLEPQEVPLQSPPVTSVRDFLLYIDDASYRPIVSARDAVLSTRFALDTQEKAAGTL